MPGPANARRKRKNRNNKASNKAKTTAPAKAVDSEQTKPALQHDDSSSSPSSPSPGVLRTPSPSFFELLTREKPYVMEEGALQVVEEKMCQEPFIYDPGNGPRVRDACMFMTSFFAQPPSIDDPLCAEFAQEEVFEMLCTILPEESALILWYNKSRSTSRVCPACQRLYRLGEVLPEHIGDSSKAKVDRGPPSPHLRREQEISGLCSPVCFILASFNFPNAIKSAWGRTADEMDDLSWDMLNTPEFATQGAVGQALGMVVKMTRLHDLGLAQLCFEDEDEEEEEEELFEGIEHLAI